MVATSDAKGASDQAGNRHVCIEIENERARERESRERARERESRERMRERARKQARERAI